MLLNENRIDEWVRANAEVAQGIVVETIWRLVAAAAPKPRERRFPLGDSVGQHGRDGILEVDLGLPPYFPDGRSIWEIGTVVDPQDKATSDYNSASASTPDPEKAVSALIVVTPLSGRRGWDSNAQTTWLNDRNERGKWREVRVVDGTRLTEWLHRFPSVELWLAETMLGVNAPDIDTFDRRWNLLRSYGSPPQLVAELFVANRDLAREKLNQVLANQINRVRLETLYPDQVADFVTGHLASLDGEALVEASSRCLFIASPEAWSRLCELDTPHLLVAEAGLDLSGDAGTRLLQLAQRGGHSVVFGGLPGGIPDPSSVPLPIPRVEQVEEALKAAGYGDEPARTLASRSAGNLGSLKRILQNLAAAPGWADGPGASDLAIAAAIGSWAEEVQGDVLVVEGIAGNAYGAWSGLIRDQSFLAGAPLTQSNGVWKFGPRYEGWYALGPRLFRTEIERLRAGIVATLAEDDPRVELSSEDRPLAGIRGIGLAHSEELRTGLADATALLGAHGAALKALPSGLAETVAHSIVRELLDHSDWKRWASLNPLLPLLAEAAPNAFLEAAEHSLQAPSGPFESLFALESGGTFGSTYLSGTLWALETLAWSPEHLGRVVLLLGQLGSLDQGGSWSNRPINSLTMILLPWLPQTTASFERRIAAIRELIQEEPDVGWSLLVSLLPTQTQVSHGSRRPTWRQWIPDDWTGKIPRSDYALQIDQLSSLAVSVSLDDPKKLIKLIEHLEVLPEAPRAALIDHLAAGSPRQFSKESRLQIWQSLKGLVSRHRAFADAEWAMDPIVVNRVAVVADRLAPEQPELAYNRLFTDRGVDLFEEKGNWEAQHEKLETRRDAAVREIFEKGGIAGVQRFAVEVRTPWRVGLALGRSGTEDADAGVLPDLIVSEDSALREFAQGYVVGRFASLGFEWADGLDMSTWSDLVRANVLVALPFISETWERAERVLSDPREYWSRTPANPYGYKTELGVAVDRLLDSERPFAAIRCIYHVLATEKELLVDPAIRALDDGVRSTETRDQMAEFETLELIKALQGSDASDADRVADIEWAYLPILDNHSGVRPIRLESRLARDPMFFSQLINLVFKSETDGDRHTERNVELVANGYRLLSNWSTPPGIQVTGEYDGTALQPWLRSVAKNARAAGRYPAAMTMAGHVLVHVPPDHNGLWIDTYAARALNARGADELRDGFRTAEINSRGAHWIDASGQEDRNLATKYRDRADALDVAGFSRFAAVMRQLEAGYLLEVKRSAEQDW